MSDLLLDKIKNKKSVIVIIGLGRVGLPLASVFANCGLKVIGVDVNQKHIELISKSESPFDDPQLQTSLEKAISSGNLQVYDDISKIKEKIDIIIVTVGTPTTSDNTGVDYSQLYSALEKICSVDLKNSLIILRSTMPPGTTTDVIIPFLESNTNYKCGIDFMLSVCPERILEGHAIKEIHDLPEIIGGINEKSNELSSELFLIINREKEMLYTSVSGAELAKLFANIYRYINFALSNEFAIWAEKYGLDASELIRIANYNYPRSNIPKPGFAGGPCLSKDGSFLDNNTTYTGIISTAWKLNEGIPQYIVNKIKSELGNIFNKKITVLGISFKANSDDLRNSPSLKLVDILKSTGAKVVVHDPHVKNTVSLEDALESTDVVILATNHDEFKQIDDKILKSGCTLIYDVWAMFDEKQFPGVKYMRFGRGSN